jgi:integrase
MATKFTGRWQGGRTYETSDGRTVFVIERMRHGRRYTTPLDVGTKREALAELALFERDPDAYTTRVADAGLRASEVVRMEAALVGRFLEYLAREQRTERYRKNTRYYLSQWAEALAGRDLRTVTLQDLKRALVRWPKAYKARVIAIKTFLSYVREVEALVTPAQDPTLALKVPPARPGKKLKERAYDLKVVDRFYRATDNQAVRDVLLVLAKTGLHGTELSRIARGEAEVLVLPDQGAITATIRFVHKSGEEHVQSVDAQTLAAVQRLVRRGQIPVDAFLRKHMRVAGKKLGEEPILLGRLRHCFITWAQDVGVELKPKSAGVPLATVAAIVGHKSAKTTRLFYTGFRVPSLLQLPLRLEHPDDPVEITRAAGARPG